MQWVPQSFLPFSHSRPVLPTDFALLSYCVVQHVSLASDPEGPRRAHLLVHLAARQDDLERAVRKDNLLEAVSKVALHLAVREVVELRAVGL